MNGTWIEQLNEHKLKTWVLLGFRSTRSTPFDEKCGVTHHLRLYEVSTMYQFVRHWRRRCFEQHAHRYSYISAWSVLVDGCLRLMLWTNRSEFWVGIKVIRLLGTNELKSCSMHISTITWPTQIHCALMSPMSWGPKNLSRYKGSRKNLSCNMTTWRMMRVSKVLKSLEAWGQLESKVQRVKKEAASLLKRFPRMFQICKGCSSIAEHDRGPFNFQEPCTACDALGFCQTSLPGAPSLSLSLGFFLSICRYLLSIKTFCTENS